MAEPGITQTDILKLNKPDKGYFNWDVPLNENWDKLDVLGAGQLPLLSLLEVRHKLSGADLIGWSLQGSELDGDVYTSVWDLVYAAKQRASTQKSKQIREITYYYAQDEVTGMVFVDSENYNKGLSNLGDSLGYICTYVDGVKYIKLPEDRSFNGAILSGDGIPGEFEDESLPNITGEFRGRNAWNGHEPEIQTGALYSKGNLSKVYGSQQSGNNTYSLNFDASRSSSTYQDGAPVKPRTHKTYRYYKVGNTVVNSGQIDMGNVLGTLASVETSKAGTDLLNVTAVGKARSISWGMPDYSAKIEVPWNTEVTRIYPCFVNVFSSGTVKSSVIKITINNVVIDIYDEGGESGSSGSGQFFIPANTPYKVSGGYYDNGTICEFPLQGVN